MTDYRADAYDDFWDVYPAWVTTAPPQTVAGGAWFAKQMASSAGPVCELGVGDGRVAIPAALAGAEVIGVDGSQKMLDRLMQAAEAAGVADRITPVRADMRDFALDAPVSMVTIPFHSIGHMLSSDDKLACMRAAHAALAPGGQFLWDHFVFDPAIARMGAFMALRTTYESPLTGRRGYLFASHRAQFATQRLDVVVRSDEVDERGVVVEQRYRQLDYSWIEPAQSRELLAQAGFEVAAAYGDFDGTPLGDDAKHQVWVARRGA
ncbi:MAG: class I SAM-dependent methyltransferase [Planctomycetota bacterium]